MPKYPGCKKPGHIWLQLTDEEILLNTHLAKKDDITGELKIKYAALILFGKDDTIEDIMPRYRFEALFHMCTYEEYNALIAMMIAIPCAVI